jgi:hypothetical protein
MAGQIAEKSSAIDSLVQIKTGGDGSSVRFSGSQKVVGVIGLAIVSQGNRTQTQTSRYR